MPLLGRGTALGARYLIEDILEALSAVERELEGHGKSVDYPTKDILACFPVGVAF
jgi:hypothetical protein